MNKMPYRAVHDPISLQIFAYYCLHPGCNKTHQNSIAFRCGEHLGDVNPPPAIVQHREPDPLQLALIYDKWSNGAEARVRDVRGDTYTGIILGLNWPTDTSDRTHVWLSIRHGVPGLVSTVVVKLV